MDIGESDAKFKSIFNDLFGDTPIKMSPIQSPIQSTEPLSLSVKVSIPLEVAKLVLFDVQQSMDSKEGRPIETVTSRKRCVKLTIKNVYLKKLMF